MMKKGIILGILLTVFICSCIPQKKSIRLQYKYKEGEVLKYKITTISNGTITPTNSLSQDASISPIGIKTNTRCIFTQKVIGIEPGELANIEINYDLCDMEIKMDEASIPTIFFKKQENPFFKLMEGKKINIKVGRDGSLIEIKGIEEIFDQILTQIPNEMPEEFINKFKEECERSIIRLIEENYQRLPLEEMRIGDMWIRELDYNIPFGGTMRGKSTYTIEEFKQIKGLKCAKIDIDTTMNFGKNNPELFDISNLDIELKGVAKGNGKILFAYEEGKLLNTDLRINMAMEVNYIGTGGEKQMQMAAKINLDTLTVVELE